LEKGVLYQHCRLELQQQVLVCALGQQPRLVLVLVLVWGQPQQAVVAGSRQQLVARVGKQLVEQGVGQQERGTGSMGAAALPDAEHQRQLVVVVQHSGVLHSGVRQGGQLGQQEEPDQPQH
jgi:hypothetical protein